MLWSKQFYHYDVRRWLDGDPTQPPPPPERETGRNAHWRHLNNLDVISMPDTWEYPWYAAWDLAFHCVPLAHVDPEFAKAQLLLLGREWYMHPNGQLPAYEWEFGDVNPPVHAWAALQVFRDRRLARHRLPRARLPQAAPQLHLVGEPQGRRGRQRLPGRLPRARQHRPVQPLGPAGVRHPRAVRRHLLDGDVLPEPARARARPGGARPDVRRPRDEVLRALRADRVGAERRRALERGGRLLLRPAAPARRHDDPAAGSLGGRAPPARRGDDDRPRDDLAPPRLRRREPNGSCSTGPRRRTSCSTPSRPHTPAGGCSRSSTRSDCGACSRRCSTRASSSPTTASARSRSGTQAHPLQLDDRGGLHDARLRAGRVDERALRWQLQLARPGVAARSTTC